MLIFLYQTLLNLLRSPKRTTVLSVLIASSFLIKALQAAPLPPLSFLDNEQGLSNNTVRCIFQDHSGFIWLGTFDGLNRYDGYDCKVYRNRLDDPHSLIHNIILSITEDSLHRLWIGTRQGVSRLSPLWDRFSSVYLRGHKDQPLNAVIKDIRADHNNNVFLATEGMGLLICAQGNTEAEPIPLAEDGRLITGYTVKTVRMDAAGNIWALVHKHGLARYNYATRQLMLVTAALPNASWLETQGSNLVISNGASLYGYNPATPQPALLFDYSRQQPDAGSIVTFSIDEEGRYWMGTVLGHLLTWTSGEKVASILGRMDGSQSKSTLGLHALYIDRQSRKWIGTATSGAAVIDPHKSRFQTLAYDPGNPHSLADKVVSALYQSDDDLLYIGTDGGGVSIWNRQNNTFTTLSNHPGDPHALSDNAITAITADHDRHIWIATFRQGLNRYTPATRSIKHYSLLNPTSNTIDRVTYGLLEDHSHQLWVSTLRQNGVYGALYRFNAAKDQFEVFDSTLSDLFTLYEDGNGVLWGGNLNQLVKIDRVTKKHTYYNIGYAVRSIHEDKGGNLWIGTEGGGLQLFDRIRQSVTARYATKEGLCSDVVLTILEDSSGHLWMSTFNGLARFDRNKRTCRNFYQADGLQSNQFHYNSALALRDGQLAFGGIKGLNLFNPEAIRVTHAMPPLQMTDIVIDNTPVTTDSSYIKQVANGNIADITLPYSKAVLSFKFTALEYSVPGKIAYAYYMDGWDHSWNYAGNLRTATYTHLSEGSYVFRVKNTNGEGEWNTHQIAIHIRVLPPFYRTWWAYALYGACLIAGIYLFIGYKTRQNRLQYEIKVAQLQTREAQLHAQKEKEVHEKRLTFFTNLSNEFRTPLTLIIDPVKEIIAHEKDPAQKEGLHMVFRNARRLLSLIDQLLLFRKAETEADTLHLTLLNVTELCREVYYSFVQQAHIKKLDYRFECDSQSDKQAPGSEPGRGSTNDPAKASEPGSGPDQPTPIELCADRQKLEIMVFNLVSNAIKFTPPGGRVSLRLEETDTAVNIQVVDNGSGIPARIGDKLFNHSNPEKDGPEKEGPEKDGKGFGIGLFLVKHFTTLHHGHITYDSRMGEGTTFSLTLLKGTTHFAAHEINPEEQSGSSKTAPPAPEEVITTPDKGKELSTLVTGKPTLLVVDDDDELRTYLSKAFSSEYNVLQATDGQKGLALARQYLPDLIINDIEMGGVELCRQVKETPSLSHIPVILLTGSTASETKLRGIEAGADDFITKPFEKELLKARVVSLLKKQVSLQQYFYNEITLQQQDGKVSIEYREFLDKCIRIVEDHLDDETFSIKTLTTEMGMSRSSLYRKINSVSGQSIIGFVRFIRLRKAARLMIDTENNVTEIATITGFNDIKYFRTHFSELFGMPPSEYIRRFRKPFHNNLQLNNNIRKPD